MKVSSSLMRYEPVEKYNLVIQEDFVIGSIEQENGRYVAYTHLTNSPLYLNSYYSIEKAKSELLKVCNYELKEMLNEDF